MEYAYNDIINVISHNLDQEDRLALRSVSVSLNDKVRSSLNKISVTRFITDDKLSY